MSFVLGVIAFSSFAGSRLNVSGLDVDEDRPRAEAGDGARRREERVGRRHDVVARPDAERHHDGELRVGPGRHADRVRGADVRGDRLLEGLDPRPQDEVLALVDLGRRAQNLVLADRRVLFPQVEERDGDGRRGHGHDE